MVHAHLVVTRWQAICYFNGRSHLELGKTWKLTCHTMLSNMLRRNYPFSEIQRNFGVNLIAPKFGQIKCW
jgi:hypothetical protein